MTPAAGDPGRDGPRRGPACATPPSRVLTGVNGFGRFGLHLLRYWLDRADRAPFTIAWLNDEALTPDRVLEIVREDPYVHFDPDGVELRGTDLLLTSPGGTCHLVRCTSAASRSIPWLGEPHLFLECSGRNEAAELCRGFLGGRTRQVLVSASCEDADQTLVYGFNHETWSPEARVVSYGSCTVNAYVPLAAWMHRTFGVLDSDVHVVHNTPRHRRTRETLVRRPCTLEWMGPALLDFLDPERFTVRYTVIPYSGVSSLDVRFRVRRRTAAPELAGELERAVLAGDLRHLYGVDPTDRGPEVHNCTPWNAVFVLDEIRVRGDNVHLHAYVDTENSASRFFDLTAFIAGRIRNAGAGAAAGHGIGDAPADRLHAAPASALQRRR